MASSGRRCWPSGGGRQPRIACACRSSKRAALGVCPNSRTEHRAANHMLLGCTALSRARGVRPSWASGSELGAASGRSVGSRRANSGADWSAPLPAARPHSVPAQTERAQRTPGGTSRRSASTQPCWYASRSTTAAPLWPRPPLRATPPLTHPHTCRCRHRHRRSARVLPSVR